jgi:hypothetical protein
MILIGQPVSTFPGSCLPAGASIRHLAASWAFKLAAMAAQTSCGYPAYASLVVALRHCESAATKQSSFLVAAKLECFAEPVIGRRYAPTRWLAMTG